MTGFVRRAAIMAALFAAPIGAVVITSSAVAAAHAAAPALAGDLLAAEQAVGAAPTVVAQAVRSVARDALSEAKVSGKKNAKKAKKAKVASKHKSTKKSTKSSGTKPVPSASGSSGSTPTAVESQVVALTNQYRVANGCRALRVDNRLVAAARAHSTDMVTHNFFSHTGFDGSTFVTRAARAGYANASAENIAWGWRTAQIVVDQWMNSPGHRANILNCSNVVVGVGLVTKSDGTPYWTQDFGRV